MTCDEARELAYRQATGGLLKRSERAALAAHLEACSACRAEAGFEKLLVAGVHDALTVSLSPDFMARFMQALPGSAVFHSVCVCVSLPAVANVP